MGDMVARHFLLVGRCPTCQVKLRPATDEGWEACGDEACGRMYRVNLDQSPPAVVERIPMIPSMAGRRVDCAAGLRAVVGGEAVEMERDDMSMARVPVDAEMFELDW